MAVSVTQVDAFTSEPYRGNPAAVCVLDEPAEADWMRAIAREMNLSETAFLWPHEGEYDLRWFTPTTEVELCGHATLASAHVLWERELIAPDGEAVFHTLSGRLTARRAGGRIEMDFPAEPEEEAEPPPELANALGAEPVYVGRNRFDYLVELDSAQQVHDLRPQVGALRELPVRGIIVTAAADGGDFDFVSRFFAPRSGVDEDPVTGSAHCCLGPFWRKRLGRDEFTAFQASSRGGTVGVGVRDGRVLLGGEAVTVMRGELLH